MSSARPPPPSRIRAVSSARPPPQSRIRATTSAPPRPRRRRRATPATVCVGRMVGLVLLELALLPLRARSPVLRLVQAKYAHATVLHLETRCNSRSRRGDTESEPHSHSFVIAGQRQSGSRRLRRYIRGDVHRHNSHRGTACAAARFGHVSDNVCCHVLTAHRAARVYARGTRAHNLRDAPMLAPRPSARFGSVKVGCDG